MLGSVAMRKLRTMSNGHPTHTHKYGRYIRGADVPGVTCSHVGMPSWFGGSGASFARPL